MAPLKKKRQQTLKGSHGNVQVVLTEDVTYLGKQGDLVEVRPGYARNYLLPRGLAAFPSAHNLRLLEHYKIKVQAAREARMADLRTLSAQLQAMPGVTITANAGEGGHLYGSVAAPDISKALKAAGYRIEPEMVKMEGVIKETGLYEVELHLGFDIDAKVKVAVVPTQEKK